MKQLSSIFLVLLCACGFNLSAQGDINPNQARYVERYSEIAMREMERAGVPASIKLAQGLLESDAGRSVLARSGNNHFGIKCGSNWNGETVYRKDDDYDDKGQLIKSCFRGYRNPEASFVAHSEFLRDPRKAFRYGFLFRLDPMDYRSWAEGLRRAGYATNPRYPQLLISLIERYKLYQYDEPSASSTINDPIDIETPAAELVAGILRTNDVTYFVSDESLTVEEVARRVDVGVRRLIDYNEKLSSDNQRITPGQRVFIQKKRNSYRGTERYHTVLAGETLQEISDRYAIRMDKLLKRNRLTSAEQRVAPGEKLKLRGGKVGSPPRLGGVPVTTTPDRPTVPTDNDGNLDLDTNRPLPPPARPNPGGDNSRPTVPVPDAPPPLPGSNEPDFGNDPVTPPPTVIPDLPTDQPDPVPTNPDPTDLPPPVVVDPSQPPVVSPPADPPTTPPATTPRIHTVVRGDTLYNISRRFNLTVDELKRLNGLTSNLISIGQELKVN